MNHACHFVIETPNGEFSDGKCKTCGAEKKFRNWVYEEFVMDYRAKKKKLLLRELGV